MHSALFVVYWPSKSDLQSFPCLKGNILTYRQASAELTDEQGRSFWGGRSVDNRPSRAASATWLLTIIPQILSGGTASTLLVTLTGSPTSGRGNFLANESTLSKNTFPFHLLPQISFFVWIRGITFVFFLGTLVLVSFSPPPPKSKVSGVNWINHKMLTQLLSKSVV